MLPCSVVKPQGCGVTGVLYWGLRTQKAVTGHRVTAHDRGTQSRVSNCCCFREVPMSIRNAQPRIISWRLHPHSLIQKTEQGSLFWKVAGGSGLCFYPINILCLKKKKGDISRAESSCFSSSALPDWEQSYKFGCPSVLFATSLVTTPIRLSKGFLLELLSFT